MQGTDLSFEDDNEQLSEAKKKIRVTYSRGFLSNKVTLLQIIIIILLLINIGATMATDAEAEIKVVELVIRDSGTFDSAHIRLKNIGNAKATVHVLGEFFYSISDSHSQYPEYYDVVSIDPGEVVSAGVGKVYGGVTGVKVYIHWNAGSITYGKRLSN
jgi:hypothetical protein